MRTVKLKTGEIIFPSGVYENGMMGTALTLSLPGDPEYADLLAEAVDAKPGEEAELKRTAQRLKKARR